jgi:hypothetical protein
VFSTDDKLKCLRRELALRERVYPARCIFLTSEATREIEIIKAIIADYEARVE